MARKSIPVPQVQSILFARNREAFTHRVESYPHWVMLGLLRGKFSFGFAREKKSFCEPGQFVLCPPGVPLRRQAVGAISFYFIQFQWKQRMAALWKGQHSPADWGRMESTLKALENLGPHPAGEADRAWANHLLHDLVLLKYYENSQMIQSPKRKPDRQMLEAAELLGKDLREPTQLEELAFRFRLTPSQFSRRFKTAMGASAVAYRTGLRMKEARRLLVETGLSLQEIAEACGYENAFYFSRVFRAENGRSPSHFRRSLRV